MHGRQARARRGRGDQKRAYVVESNAKVVLTKVIVDVADIDASAISRLSTLVNLGRMNQERIDRGRSEIVSGALAHGPIHGLRDGAQREGRTWRRQESYHEWVRKGAGCLSRGARL